MIYISKHIADQIDKYRKPLFNEQHASNFKLNDQVVKSIKTENNNFNFNQQQNIVSDAAQLINTSFNSKINKLEEKQQSLAGIEEIKIHSFFHYLKSISFKGYGKWITLN